MKKILFIVPSFQHGGTNRSFCNIIDLFDFNAHNISADLLCIKKSQETPYLKEFESRGINILPENSGLSIKHYSGKNIFKRALSRIVNILPQNISDFIMKLSCKRYDNQYHAVISMEEGISTRVATYIKSPRTVAWLRCMYDRYYELTNNKDESFVYDKIDTVVCVSKECRNSLLSIYPQYETKTICIPNTQNREKILKKAEIKQDVLLDENCFNIVSVGRLDEVKQFHLIPEIMQKLLNSNFNAKWYIIGDGNCKTIIADKSNMLGVSQNVILLGAKSNPYPIMKQADLIAVTSLSESFCNVISEGAILNKRIISTPFQAVYNTMADYKNGFICDLEDFPDKIKKIASIPVSDCDPVTLNKDDIKIIEFVKELEKVF